MSVEIKAFAATDIREVVTLLSSCLAADVIDSRIFLKKVLLDRNFDSHGAPVAIVGNRIVGFALGITRKYPLEDAPPDYDRSWITLIAVRADFRRQGIGTRLVEWLENYFDSAGCESVWISPYAPNYFTPGIDVAAYPEALAFFKSLDYVEIMLPLAMRADLTHFSMPEWAREKERKLSNGVVIEPFQPELVLPILEWMRTEFPGDWQRVARESITKIACSEFTADNVWIVHRSGNVVGYCQHDNDGRLGPLGVSRSERGQGIGRLLVLRCLNAMRRKGMCHAWLMWTDDNVAKLYASAGFREHRRFAVLKKSLR